MQSNQYIVSIPDVESGHPLWYTWTSVYACYALNAQALSLFISR